MAISDDIQAMADSLMQFEDRQNHKIQAEDRLLDREIRVKHVAWKLDQKYNEIWIDGVLGVVFTPNQENESGSMCTKVNYILQKETDPVTKTAFFLMELNEIAKCHLAWLTDPAVFIDSATIDMEYNSELMIENRSFRISHLNISIQSNYAAIHGWLQHMHADVESFIFRGNGLMDAQKFVQLPFASKLKKMMVVYESAFDDRTLNLLTAEHIQLASDLITDAGINRMIHRWNELDYPIRSTFIIYMTIRSPDSIMAKMNVMDSVHNDNGVSEYLIEMSNASKRMRLVVRSSSVIGTIFAVTNCS